LNHTLPESPLYAMSNPSLRLLRSPRIPNRCIIFSKLRPIVPRIGLQSSRSASTTATDATSLVTRLKNLLYGTSLSLFLAFSYLYITDTRASVHQWLAVPSLRWLYPDAEDAHHVGTEALKALYAYGLHPRERVSKSEEAKNADLSVTVFGQRLQNPIGTSAGIDKLAEIPDALLALGPAIVEVGGATPWPQDGNPKPRVFRLPSQKGLINRYGLNSLGADDMAMRLRERVRLFAYHNGYGIGEDAEQLVLNGEAGVPPGSLVDGKMLAVQIAKNKFTKDEDIDAVRNDYVYCVERLAPYADILVVNVSSPNTPGLRTLQRVEPLTRILEGVVDAAKSVKRKRAPKVMVKVSPDEDQDEQIEGIVEAIWRSGVDGVIVGNTTKRRNVIPQGTELSARERRILEEQGGYSGPQMFERTLGLVKRYRRLLDQGPPALPQEKNEDVSPKPVGGIPSGDDPAGTITEKIQSVKESLVGPGGAGSAAVGGSLEGIHEQKVIFATGGVTNGKQALEILNAGASVAQIYTALSKFTLKRAIEHANARHFSIWRRWDGVSDQKGNARRDCKKIKHNGVG
jgi:dihydroorotate dehydrogenase